jgi:hypothetical protein
MYAQLDIFEERNNAYFVSMLKDINPHVYKISTNRFVFVDKRIGISGKADIANPHISIYVNGVLQVEFDAPGGGAFSLPATASNALRLQNGDNEVQVVAS